jgi:hypothetical protein
MLSYPPSCSVTFCCSNRSYWPDDAPRPFQNPTFLVDVRRVKLKTRSADRQDYVEGMVEIIDAAHRRVRSKQQVVLRDVTWDEVLTSAINPLFPGFLKDLDVRFIEVLCVEELALWFYEEGDRVEEVLGHLKNIRTLILSDSAVDPFLCALARTTDVNGWRCLKLDTLAIYSKRGDPAGEDILSTLHHVARRREAAGFPLRTVSVFLGWTRNPKHLEWMGSDLEELRRYIGTFKLVMGDDALDWNVDDYFLDGLDNFRRD